MQYPTLASSMETIASLSRQLEAKQKRIDHLEMVLQQRQIETRRTFNPDKIDEMKNKVYMLWLDAEPGTGFTYEEATEEFFYKYHFRSANVGQRIRDLRQEGKLWSKDVAHKGEDKVTFFLTLKEQK